MRCSDFTLQHSAFPDLDLFPNISLVLMSFQHMPFLSGGWQDLYGAWLSYFRKRQITLCFTSHFVFQIAETCGRLY